MGIFSNKNPIPSDSAVIIGCGRLGASIAATLSDNGGQVSIVDNQNDSFRRLPQSFEGLKTAGNATDIRVLKNLQIDEQTTVFCMTNNDNTNILIAQMCKLMFNAGRVIARLNDIEKSCLFNGQGIEAVCPTDILSQVVSQLFSNQCMVPNAQSTTTVKPQNNSINPSDLQQKTYPNHHNNDTHSYHNNNKNIAEVLIDNNNDDPSDDIVLDVILKSK